MTLQMIKDYKDISEYRLSFNKLAGRIFGIDFERWYQFGFWTDRYACYSFIDGDQVVANVSANRLDLIRQGLRINAIQIGTVMTAPEYRGRGLAAELMKVVLAEYEGKCDMVYLFSNKITPGFYQKFAGFQKVKECRFSAHIPATGDSRYGLRKLNLSELKDLNILKRLAAERTPLSGIFDVERAEHILTWHCMNSFPEDVFYLEALDSLIIFKVEEADLHLYTILLKKFVFLANFLRRYSSLIYRDIFSTSWFAA